MRIANEGRISSASTRGCVSCVEERQRERNTDTPSSQQLEEPLFCVCVVFHGKEGGEVTHHHLWYNISFPSPSFVHSFHEMRKDVCLLFSCVWTSSDGRCVQ